MTSRSTSPAADIPRSVTVIIGSVWEVLGSAAWAQALGDDYQRTWLLTQAVCDALYIAGIERVPSASVLQDALNKMSRKQSIITEFDGKNYSSLARKYRLSTRTVRRIIERERRKDEQNCY